MFSWTAVEVRELRGTLIVSRWLTVAVILEAGEFPLLYWGRSRTPSACHAPMYETFLTN